MPLVKVVVEATGIVTVDDPADPAESVPHYLFDEDRARAFSLERLKNGDFPDHVVGVLEGHVGADTDDVEGDEAKVSVSISILVDAEDVSAAQDMEADPAVLALLHEIASEKMGVDFDMEAFETLEAEALDGVPDDYTPEHRAAVEAKIVRRYAAGLSAPAASPST